MLFEAIKFKTGYEYYNFGYGFFVGIIMSFFFYGILAVSIFFNIISDETFRYLFSAMAQTLGAIVALSATFFIIFYDNIRKKRDDYYNRLIRILLSMSKFELTYGDLYLKYKNSEKIAKDIYLKIQEVEDDCMNYVHAEISTQYEMLRKKFEAALRFSTSFYSDYLTSALDSIDVQDVISRELQRCELCETEINWNIDKYLNYREKLEKLKKNIRDVYVCNLIFIAILTIILALTDISFNPNINIVGAILLSCGLLLFIIGLYLIGKSILETIRE